MSYKDLDLKDKIGRWRTQSLFWEYRKEGYDPVFTIKDYDHTVDGVLYPSLKKIYLSYDHVPEKEYSFATEVLGGWQHWQLICENKLFKDEIYQWRNELEIKLQEQALKAMITTALQEGSKGTAAAKYLADKGYKGIRGRPSKAEVERERKIQAQVSKDLEEDFERIGLRVINGDR